MEKRIKELEKLIAHQDHTIEQLNEAILEQHKAIEILQERLKVVEARLSDERLVKPQEEEERPPHY